MGNCATDNAAIRPENGVLHINEVIEALSPIAARDEVEQRYSVQHWYGTPTIEEEAKV